MKILVTGGAGFLGQQLTRALLDRGSLRLASGDAKIDRVVCFDQTAGVLQDPRVDYVTGDISDPATVRGLVDRDTAVVVHLAAVVSGGAEADFDLGMRVNLDGTRLLLEACRAAGHQPRVLFTSSIAVFGGDLPPVVTDATTPTPQGSYGVQKLIGELLVQDFSRKGYITGAASACRRSSCAPACRMPPHRGSLRESSASRLPASRRSCRSTRRRRCGSLRRAPSLRCSCTRSN